MGPLTGIHILDCAALAPAPMGAKTTAALGAEPVPIDRKPPPVTRTGSERFHPALDILKLKLDILWAMNDAMATRYGVNA